MSFIVCTKAQAKAIRRALREQDGLPAKGVTVGACTWKFEPPELQADEGGDPLPTPGWTTDNLDAGDAAEAGDQIAIEVPTRFERFAGKTIKGVALPPLVDESALPDGIKRVRAKRLAEGTP